MRYVLITLSRGIIDQVIFHDDASRAVKDLAEYVRSMNIEEDDASVYGSEGLIANAKAFLEGFSHGGQNRAPADKARGPVYIIADPCHSLGFLVVSPYEPLGYDDPLQALSVLENMRKEHGTHITLYRVEPVKGALAKRADLEQYNADRDVEDFEYLLVQEYLN